jgi:hypothetical protein
MTFPGFIIMIAYQYIGRKIIFVNSDSKNLLSFLFLALSIGLTALNYVWLQENFWLFWIEKTLFELAAFFTSMIIYIIVKSRQKKDYSTVPIFLFIFTILLIGSYDLILAWLKLMPYKQSGILQYFTLLIIFILNVLWIYPFMTLMTKDKIANGSVNKILDINLFWKIVLLEVLIWIFVIPIALTKLGYL